MILETLLSEIVETDPVMRLIVRSSNVKPLLETKTQLFVVMMVYSILLTSVTVTRRLETTTTFTGNFVVMFPVLMHHHVVKLTVLITIELPLLHSVTPTTINSLMSRISVNGNVEVTMLIHLCAELELILNLVLFKNAVIKNVTTHQDSLLVTVLMTSCY